MKMEEIISDLEFMQKSCKDNKNFFAFGSLDFLIRKYKHDEVQIEESEDEEEKLHFFQFYFETPDGAKTRTKGLNNKEITFNDIRDTAMSAGVEGKFSLISTSYLGFMSIDHFNYGS